MIILKKDSWYYDIIDLLNAKIKECHKDKEYCNVFLTGGSTAKTLYKSWGQNKKFNKLKNINFFLSDERFVSNKSFDSNYKMILDNLFPEGLPNNSTFTSIVNSQDSLEESVRKFEEKLSNIEIDIMIFSMGIDGHIASIFPNSKLFGNEIGLAASSLSPLKPFKRITVTPSLIELSKFTILLGIGNGKRELMRRLHNSDETAFQYPALIVDSKHWYTDT